MGNKTKRTGGYMAVCGFIEKPGYWFFVEVSSLYSRFSFTLKYRMRTSFPQQVFLMSCFPWVYGFVDYLVDKNMLR
jgi:hypothetical protein